MNPERYRLVKSILQEALELDPAHRPEYLEKACGDDRALRSDVESLIEHDSASDRFLETAAAGGTELRPGTTIGPYVIAAPVAAGGMGEVYRASDPRFARDVAIKFLAAAYARDPDRISRFEREARAAGSLNHPNILTVHDFGWQYGAPYLVTELLEGGTLRERLGGGPIEPKTAIGFASQIARGLAAAHGKGIVHRDLKPENLFVSREGAVKILDFGLAKLPGLSGSHSAPGMLLGTMGYMSPEQVRGEPAGPASDVFSLGVILYEMLAGTRPFAAETWAEEASAILKLETPELPPSGSGFPDAVELAGVVGRCLAKRPEDRFPSASELAASLDRLLVRPERKRASKFRFIAAAALVAGGGFIWTVLSKPADVPQTSGRGVVSAARFTAGDHEILYSAKWDLDDAFHVYSAPVDDLTSQPTGRATAMLFAASSRGDVAVCEEPHFTQHSVFGTLILLPYSGGPPVDLGELGKNIAAADFTRDGSQIAAVRREGDHYQIEFPLGSVLYSGRSGGYIDAVRISPRGDLIAFFDHPLLDDAAGFVAVLDRSRKDQQYRQISGRFNSMRGLAWSPDGREVWFAAAKQGIRMALWSAGTSGGERRRSQHFETYVSLEDISATQGALLGFHELSQFMVYVAPDGSSKTLDRLDQSQVRDIDGDQVLYSDSGNTTAQDYVSYRCTLDKLRDPERLGLGLPLALSREHGVIANPASPDDAPAQLTILPVPSGPQRPLTRDGINHVGAAWLPDGSFIFAGTAPGEQLRYFRQTPTSAPNAITGDISYERRSPVVVHPDGTFVAALDKEQRITIFPTNGGDPKPVPRLESGLTPLRWCADNRLVATRYNERPQLWKVDPSTGKQSLWATLNPPNLVGLLDVTPIRVDTDCDSYVFSPLNVLTQVKRRPAANLK